MFHPLARVATGLRPFGTRSRRGLAPACAGGHGLTSLRDSIKARTGTRLRGWPRAGVPSGLDQGSASTCLRGWQGAGVPSGLDQGANCHPLARVATGWCPFGTQTRPGLRQGAVFHPLARVGTGWCPFVTQRSTDRPRKYASADDRRHGNKGGRSGDKKGAFCPRKKTDPACAGSALETWGEAGLSWPRTSRRSRRAWSWSRRRSRP